MAIRFAVLAGLTAFLALGPLTQSSPQSVEAQVVVPEPAPPRRSALPPPMFSPWYAESLRDILKLEEPGVVRREPASFLIGR